MLKYASEAGIAIDAESVSILVRAKQASTEGWPNQDHGKLYEALTKLAVATKPVTAATLRASGFRARASLRFYQYTAICLAVVLIPLSILSFISSGLSTAPILRTCNRTIGFNGTERIAPVPTNRKPTQAS